MLHCTLVNDFQFDALSRIEVLIMFAVTTGIASAVAAPLIAVSSNVGASVNRFFAEVPEPGMMMLFGASVAALGLYIGQKKKP
jgi:hypothetical protein